MLTSQDTSGVYQSQAARRSQLQNGTNVEQSTANQEWHPAPKLLDKVGDEDGTKEATGLEGADNIGTQRGRRTGRLTVKAEFRFEGR